MSTEAVDQFGFQPFSSEKGVSHIGKGSGKCFDPFGVAPGADIGEETGKTLPHPHRGPTEQRPKLSIKLSRHEEVVSIANPNLESEGASDCSIQGTLYAWVQSSDENRNAMFTIPLDDIPEAVMIQPHEPHSSLQENHDTRSKQLLVDVPKSSVGFVPVLHFACSQRVEHLPVLLERKVTVNRNFCRVAAQVRSKLTNTGDMEDFSVAIAVPDTIDASSIVIVHGDGEYIPTYRIIKFRLPCLTHGESFMVSAEMRLLKPAIFDDSEDLSFPILLRCSSIDDPISNVKFGVGMLDESPCTITTTATSAFRLLHRLT